MSSTNKTPNLGLNQWVAGDKPTFLEDVNHDNAVIDQRVAAAETLAQSAENQLDQTKTSIAKALADSAKALGNSELAESQASSAITSAEQAKTLAQQAKTTADEAKTSAQSANDTVDSFAPVIMDMNQAVQVAKSDAAAATQTASQAKTQAQQAITTANGVDAKATQAQSDASSAKAIAVELSSKLNDTGWTPITVFGANCKNFEDSTLRVRILNGVAYLQGIIYHAPGNYPTEDIHVFTLPAGFRPDTDGSNRMNIDGVTIATGKRGWEMGAGYFRILNDGRVYGAAYKATDVMPCNISFVAK